MIEIVLTPEQLDDLAGRIAAKLARPARPSAVEAPAMAPPTPMELARVERLARRRGLIVRGKRR